MSFFTPKRAQPDSGNAKPDQLPPAKKVKDEDVDDEEKVPKDDIEDFSQDQKPPVVPVPVPAPAPPAVVAPPKKEVWCWMNYTGKWEKELQIFQEVCQSAFLMMYSEDEL